MNNIFVSYFKWETLIKFFDNFIAPRLTNRYKNWYYIKTRRFDILAFSYS